MEVIDVFAGAGGLSIGLEAAGFSVALGVEWDADSCDTFAKAHPDAQVIQGDINATSFESWAGQVDVVAGGPPCQPWSSGGKQLGTSDSRDGWPAFIRCVREVKPRAFLAENVAGLASQRNAAQLEWLIGELEGLGYTVTPKVLNAADYGVPQKRTRLVLVGVESGTFEFPDPDHGPDCERPWRTAGEYISAEPYGTPNPSIVTYAKAPDCRPSPYDGHVFNGGGRPIDLDRPAPTLLASMGGNKTPWLDTQGVVPEYHAHLMAGGEPRSGRVPGARRITVEEAALIQTFPAGMQFVGRRSSCYRQVGNAVPPDLAKVVGVALWKHLTA